eukprot:TRINITY_DN4701_c0_g1_i1.p1 TRINITY_DN4701_c0_g1~~TRINITY_DN4701_c0_g1_i1.p1  ORF type:complete len:238 (-),score=30.68 TRINITY_DN4701_c0_g1_i1:164-877(-)
MATVAQVCLFTTPLSHSSFLRNRFVRHSQSQPGYSLANLPSTSGRGICCIRNSGKESELVNKTNGPEGFTSSQNADTSALTGRRLLFSSAIALSTLPISCLTVSTANAATGTCELEESPSGLSFCDTEVGSGDPAVAGALIKAHYTGRLLDGRVFDSSYGRGRPLVFRVGVGEVIKGWDLGIVGTYGIPPMLPGGKRVLKIPADLAYGSRGAGCRGGFCAIPPNSVLVFDVEYVGRA